MPPQTSARWTAGSVALTGQLSPKGCGKEPKTTPSVEESAGNQTFNPPLGQQRGTRSRQMNSGKMTGISGRTRAQVVNFGSSAKFQDAC